MTKGLYELRKIELKWQYGVFTFIPNFEVIEKELKALEIIKTKKVNIDAFISISHMDYDFYLKHFNYWFGTTNETLTQEEYDLLKEVVL